jgi:hypothetical protein
MLKTLKINLRLLLQPVIESRGLLTLTDQAPGCPMADTRGITTRVIWKGPTLLAFKGPSAPQNTSGTLVKQRTDRLTVRGPSLFVNVWSAYSGTIELT